MAGLTVTNKPAAQPAIACTDLLDFMFRTIKYEETMTVHVCTDCNPKGLIHERKSGTRDTRWCRNCGHNSEGHLCEIDGNAVYHWDWHNNEHPGRSYSDVPFPSNTVVLTRSEERAES